MQYTLELKIVLLLLQYPKTRNQTIYTVKKYQPADAQRWNKFVAQAKNATFLHDRSFMEYHSDRFTDYSLLVYKGEKLVALLPANADGNDLYSHQGLTYGGILLSRKQKLQDVIAITQELLKYVQQQGFTSLYLKQLPTFYAVMPSDEFEYIAQLLSASCYRTDTASVIDYRNTLSIQSNRMEGVKKAERAGLVIKEEVRFDNFWNELLVPNLKQKHQSQPTHTLEEIKKLQAFFPENIRQFNVYHNTTIVGGATIFETKTTAHVQYISAGENKQELGTLDFLFYELIEQTFAHKDYFDFGISNEEGGTKLNRGLSYWKECFGARTHVHKFYKVAVQNHSLLKNVLI